MGGTARVFGGGVKSDSIGAKPEARRQIDERVAGSLTAGRALLAVVSSARRIQDRYDAALEPFELSLSQYQLLDFLRRKGPTGATAEGFHGGLRDLCVSAKCEAHVEKEGWLNRNHEGTRFISEPGRRLLAEVAPVLEELAATVTAGLGTDELGSLVGLTARLDPQA